MMKLRIFVMSFGLFVILTIPSSNAVAPKTTYNAFAQFCGDLGKVSGLKDRFERLFKNELEKRDIYSKPANFDDLIDDNAVVSRNIEKMLLDYANTITNEYREGELKTFIRKYKARFQGVADGQIPFLQSMKNQFTHGTLD